MWITDIIVRSIPDAVYLKYMYKKVMGKKLDLKNPQTFNEKLQWLKLYDRNPEYTKMVDKYEVRQYIKDKIGEQYLIPLVGGPWDKWEDIDFSKLPDQFVLKCTHDSGSVAICRNKDEFDFDSIRKKFNRALKGNFFYGGREWPYKNVKPRIIAEKYMEEKSMDELIDYKLMCFNSKVKATFVCSDRFSKSDLKVTFYDTEWNKLPFERHYPASSVKIEKPKTYAEMIAIAEKLSESIPFVRMDFYEIQNKIYFGECTFYPGSGMEEFNPENWDLEMGSWIKLSDNNSGGGYLARSDDLVLWLHSEGQFHDSFKSTKKFYCKGLKDYKFYTFGGVIDSIMVCWGREEGHTQYAFFNTDWNRLSYQYYEPDVEIDKPENIDEMIEIILRLSKGFAEMRVDLYNVDGRIYFGEYTIFNQSGFDLDITYETDLMWGKKTILPIE